MKIIFFLIFLNLSIDICKANDELKEKIELFKHRSNRVCSDSNSSNQDNNLDKETISNLAKNNLGLPRPNKLTKDRFEVKIGRGEIGYLFDFLDPVFEKPVFHVFHKILRKTENIDADEGIKDEYEINKILETISGGETPFLNESNLEDPTIQEKIKKYITSEFDMNVYKKSINMQKLSSILKEWNVERPNLKDIVDNYDLDGDGRLNIREFILFTIIDIRYFDAKSLPSYNEILQNLIDPLFDFIDCDKKGHLLTEDIFDGIKYIIRPNMNYDIFHCNIDDKLVHTTAINEFFLTHNKFKTGKLLIDEFRRGILLGFWDRMTTKISVEINQQLSEKNLRWKEDGQIDVSCEEIDEMKRFIN
jgi:hypothetical protein